MTTMLPPPLTTATTPLKGPGLERELDLFLSMWTEPEDPNYLFQTNVLSAPTGEFLHLRSWTHPDELLAEVAGHGLDDHPVVQNAPALGCGRSCSP